MSNHNDVNPYKTALSLYDWLRESYPDIYKEYQAVKDVAESVVQEDIFTHYQAHLQKMAMLEEVQKQRNQHLAKLLKEHTK